MSKVYTTQNDLLLENLLKYYRSDGRMERVLPIINGESSMSIRIIDWFVTNYAKKYYTVYTIYGNDVRCDDEAESGGGEVGVMASASASSVNSVISTETSSTECVPTRRFKVYVDYKLKLKAYSKRRFDPFCRWQRISIPYKGGTYVQTTLGQLNFFRWALDNKILEYIAKKYTEIEHDMNTRNSIAKKKISGSATSTGSTGSTGSDTSDSGESATSYSSASGAGHGTGSGSGGGGNMSAKSHYSIDSDESGGHSSGGTSNGTRKRREELSVSAVRSMKREVVPIIVSFA